MADIHANRQAFEACLAHARARSADRFVFLGDYVGYGGDPEWVVDQVMELVTKGATALQGNHDLAVAEPQEALQPDAETALAWTRGRLGPEARAFLASLPLRVEEGLRLYVHASPANTARWPYIDDVHAARRALEATRANLVFCGHVHEPALYGLAPSRHLLAHPPEAGLPLPLSASRRWLAVVGSVGQPRDGRTTAAYALFDAAAQELTYHRVPYDVEAAARRVEAAGLPFTLADRLRRGA